MEQVKVVEEPVFLNVIIHKYIFNLTLTDIYVHSLNLNVHKYVLKVE